MDQPVQINRSVVRRGTDLLRSLKEKEGERRKKKKKKKKETPFQPLLG